MDCSQKCRLRYSLYILYNVLPVNIQTRCNIWSRVESRYDTRRLIWKKGCNRFALVNTRTSFWRMLLFWIMIQNSDEKRDYLSTFSGHTVYWSEYIMLPMRTSIHDNMWVCTGLYLSAVLPPTIRYIWTGPEVSRCGVGVVYFCLSPSPVPSREKLLF